MKWFYNLKISFKISVLSIFLILSIVTVGIIGLNALSHVNGLLNTMNNDRLVPIYDLQEAKSSLKDIKLAVTSHVSSLNESDKKNYEDEIKKSEAKMLEHINKYSQTYLVENEVKGIELLRKSYEDYKTVRTSVIALSNSGEINEALKLSSGNGKTKFEDTVKAFEYLINIQVTVAKQLYEDSEQAYKDGMLQFSLFIFICIIIGIVLSFMTTRAVVVPVKMVTSKLKEISSNGGDLTQRIGINSKDEVGQLSNAFDGFIEKLQVMIVEISEAAIVIASSSQQLSTASSESNKVMEQIALTVNNIANGTSDNVAITEETTASLSEAAKASGSIALASKQTNENSFSVKAAAEQGTEQVGDIADTIGNISQSSRKVALLINELNVSSQKISDIVQLITNISEQTNLLALNAAIEAARAGESGRGFSVVADEIRKLAEVSNNAAKDIIALVKDNQAKSENAVVSVEEVDEMVKVAVEKSNGVKTNIENILSNINLIVEQICFVNKDSEKQALITEEINKAMQNIAASANDMAAGTEEVSASVEEQVGTMEEVEATTKQLAEMAQSLNNITSKFKVK